MEKRVRVGMEVEGGFEEGDGVGPFAGFDGFEAVVEETVGFGGGLAVAKRCGGVFLVAASSAGARIGIRVRV
jgi:hypothetical protein